MAATVFQSQGVLPRYVDLAHHCREQVVEGFLELFEQFQQELPESLLRLADQAESNAFQSHCMDVQQEIREHAQAMRQNFANELMAGFERFILGRIHPSGNKAADRERSTKPRRLSLVEKETFEIELAYDTIANSACVNYSELLHTLNHRLAVINGGTKPGERSAALPGSPHHLCDAFRAALSTIEIPIDTAVKVSLIEAFDKHVLRRAKPIYQEYNQRLIQAGILPNLEDSPLYVPPTAAASGEAESDLEAPAKPAEPRETAPPHRQSPPPGGPSTSPHMQASAPTGPAEPETQEESREQQIFQTISQLLRQRRQDFPGATAAQSSPPNVAETIQAIDRQTLPSYRSVPHDVATQPLEQIRSEFSVQLAQLAELIKNQALRQTDADVIELVGLLFEQILDDPQIPDSAKALLSYLHTPYLKLALLDRRFFFKRRHPARRLLNLLTQAGTLCNATARNEETLFAKMREVVNRILLDFDDNVELFTELLADFEEFLHRYRQRARIQEKRTIEKAKGQEKLREARQTVARELIEIIRDKSLPKVAEKLIFGPWANLLVLLYLRGGADSEVRRRYLQVTKDLVWSVQPKTTPAERQALRDKLPHIKQALQEGLALLGDPENKAEALLSSLAQYHEDSLKAEDPPQPPTPKPDDLTRYPFLQEINPEEMPDRSSLTPDGLEEAIKELRKSKLGTWFELTDPRTGQPIRAKLSWFSPKTSYYIFVNQAGTQVAVKPLRKLAKELANGEARILEMDKKPFVERTLERIYRLLHTPSQAVN